MYSVYSALHVYVTSRLTQQALTFLVCPCHCHSNGPISLGSVSKHVTLVKSARSEPIDIMIITGLRHLQIIVNADLLRHSAIAAYSVIIDDTVLQ